jgi:ribosomal protein S12
VSNNTVSISGFLQPDPYGGDGLNIDRTSTVTVKGNSVSCSQDVNYAYVNGSAVIAGSNTSGSC